MEIEYLKDNRDDDGYLINNNYDLRNVNGMAYDDVMDYLPPRLPDDEKYMQCYRSFKAMLPDEDHY